MLESSILVTSRFYYTREGIVSHVWHEILRLRMTIREDGRALIGLGVWMGNSYFPLLHFYEPARV